MTNRIGLVAVIVLLLVACEGRNPASIAEERAGRPTPTPLPRAAPEVPGQPAPPPAADVRPTIRPGKEVASNPQPVEEALKKIDVLRDFRAGKIRVEANDPQFGPRVLMLFDGDTSMPARTEEINPLILTFTFQEAVKLKTARLFPSYSTYDWALYADPEQTGLVVRQAPAEEWSRIDLPAAVETKMIRVELLRVLRDNYVHVNEVELYTE